MTVENEARGSKPRSPSFPMLSLEDAVTSLKEIYTQEQRAVVPRNVAAQHLGFSGSNGKSNRVVASLIQYGLMDEVGQGNLRVSDFGLAILKPEDESERVALLEQALYKPKIFERLLTDNGVHSLGSDGSLKSRLVRYFNFTEVGADQCVKSIRDGIEFVQSLQAQQPITIVPVEATTDNLIESTANNTSTAETENNLLVQPRFIAGTERTEGKLSDTTRVQLSITGPLRQEEYEKLKKWLSVVALPWASFLVEDGAPESND